MKNRFTAEQYTELTAAIPDGLRGPATTTIEAMIESWQSRIRELAAAPYVFGSEEFLDDVMLREILSEIGRSVSPATKAHLQELLAPADAEFRTHTVELSCDFLTDAHEADKWFSTRIPKSLDADVVDEWDFWLRQRKDPKS